MEEDCDGMLHHHDVATTTVLYTLDHTQPSQPHNHTATFLPPGRSPRAVKDLAGHRLAPAHRLTYTPRRTHGSRPLMPPPPPQARASSSAPGAAPR
jgi:hypothetical protein